MTGFQAASWRSRVSGALNIAAVLGGVVSTVLALVVLISGTRSNGDQLLLRDLAFVSFDGIVANNDTSEFLVHLHWFVNSFAWEYPTAPEGVPKVGFASRGLHLSHNIRHDLDKIAADLGLPKESYDCPGYGDYATHCKSVFFEAWRSYAFHGGIPMIGWLTWVMIFSAIVLGTLTLAQEWMIRKRPYWMRCKCIFGKRFCPCPTGTKEEIEQLDDHAWDKVRLAYWGLGAAYFALPAVQSTFISFFLIRYISHAEERLPQGVTMNLRRNTKVEMILWAAFMVSVASVLCIFIKWCLSRRPKGWMNEQTLGQLEQSAGDEPDGTLPGARRRVGGNSRYSD
ncbi:hypothetical protein EDB81DRAFT_880765 [Dactylonectria macrodidyma]|uniref:Uncharacterized protein n=1 Tax=Dactylonectria macrodidyma TaxID=307937 RepID=A0A9P9F9I5_9HYPO|nr:hypothetical protein EDB81DRAFT_880765 [Dactylonectria macrodidyma]